MNDDGVVTFLLHDWSDGLAIAENCSPGLPVVNQVSIAVFFVLGNGSNTCAVALGPRHRMYNLVRIKNVEIFSKDCGKYQYHVNSINIMEVQAATIIS